MAWAGLIVILLICWQIADYILTPPCPRCHSRLNVEYQPWNGDTVFYCSWCLTRFDTRAPWTWEGPE